ncbi:Hypothetical predicted protein [Cloeon dipterum]|uniref:Dolichyl-phosphate beta-glucosyltransferase n=1 Tax=Cloeon dipterum TaxID=197152 RepID=A0A8S1C2Z6_9INSE|nr:Hypothetical predicted protein [Cloeon dipterum]
MDTLFSFLYAVILYGFVLAVVLFLLVCIALKKLSRPYPNIVRSEKEKSFLDPVDNRRIKFPIDEVKSSLVLSVVVPAYNEESRLSVMLDECLEYLGKRKLENSAFTYEVIVVSDGSTDGTVQLAQTYSRQFTPEIVRVLELDPNRGKGGAVRLGVLSTRGSVVLFADADGATKFEDFEKLEQSLLELTKIEFVKSPEKVEQELAIVCGSRAHLEDEAIASRSIFRTILMHGFHFLVWLFAVRGIRDTQCGFKLLTRAAALQCFSNIHIERWAFDVELLYIAQRIKIPISEIAVRWTEVDGSKIVPVWSWLQMGRDLFLIWLRYFIGAWRLKTKED